MCGVKYASEAAVYPRGTIRIIGITREESDMFLNPILLAISSTFSSWDGYLQQYIHDYSLCLLSSVFKYKKLSKNILYK